MTQRGWDAIVLAGGASRRMGGADKLAYDVGGRPMLERVVAAVSTADTVVVVGPERPLPVPVVWRREEPAGSGPAAAVAAALPVVTAPVVVIVAGDQPLLSTPFVDTLVAAAGEGGAVAVDAAGEPQWLCSAWPIGLLRTARLGAGGSMRAAFAELPWTPIAADGADVFDCDTTEDLRRARTEWAPEGMAPP